MRYHRGLKLKRTRTVERCTLSIRALQTIRATAPPVRRKGVRRASRTRARARLRSIALIIARGTTDSAGRRQLALIGAAAGAGEVAHRSAGELAS